VIRPGRLLTFGLALAVLLFPACSRRELPPAATTRIVDFYLEDAQLRSLGEYVPETDKSADRSTPSASVLPWTFTKPDGTVLASGVTADTRSATSEFAEDGTADPLTVTLPWMMFSLRLPTVEGTVNLYEARPTTDEEFATMVSPRDMTVGGLLSSIGLHASGAECSRDSKSCETSSECTTPGCPRSCHNGQCVSECEGVANGEHRCTGIWDCFSNGGELDSLWSCSGAPGAVGSRCCNLDPKGKATFSPEDINAFGSNIQNIRPAKSSCPVNVLMVPEAYQDQAAFRARAATLADSLRQDKDWGKSIDYLSFWTADFFSQDTQITDPRAKVVQHTPFNTSFGTGAGRRAITIQSLDPDVENKLSEVVRKTNAAMILILVNTREYGGVASEVLGIRCVTVADEEEQNAIVGHEMGHAALGLHDEYDYGTCDLQYVAEGPNTTVHPDKPPWQSLMGTPGVGVFEGAAYCKKGAYRPASNCRMRDLETTKTFCPVCAKQLEAAFGTTAGGSALTTSGGVPLLNAPTNLLCRRGVPLR
jgi:hypothetical protein